MNFRDLIKQYEALKPEMDKAMMEVAANGNYIMGPQVLELERQLAEYTGVKHVLTCANGTDALTLAMKAWGISSGDAVFVPDFTFFASAEIVSLEGATPIFVDVDERTYNMSAESLERAIATVIEEGKLKPRVVVAVDLFGLPADYRALRDIADRHNLLILEDGAQGFGSSINGKKACSFGDIATTSFFPAKPLGCYGDGGAVFTNNDHWADLINSYRFHGKGDNKYENVRIGLNSRLDTMQAAILQVKLRAFNDEIVSMNHAANEYSRLLSGRVKTPVIPEGFASCWAQYTIQLENKGQRDRLQQALKASGIPSMVYYPKPMHLQKAFETLTQPQCAGYVSNRLCDTVLSLPIHPYITNDEIASVCSSLITFLEQ